MTTSDTSTATLLYPTTASELLCCNCTRVVAACGVLLPATASLGCSLVCPVRSARARARVLSYSLGLRFGMTNKSVVVLALRFKGAA